MERLSISFWSVARNICPFIYISKFWILILGKKALMELASQLIPNAFKGVEVRDLRRSPEFFHTNLEYHVFIKPSSLGHYHAGTDLEFSASSSAATVQRKNSV